jgi:hypothetical protein
MAQPGDMLAQIEEIVRTYRAGQHHLRGNWITYTAGDVAMDKIADILSERLAAPDG